MAAIKMASVVLSIPGCETFSCSAIAIMAAATMRTSSQERRYPSRNSQVVLGSGTRSEPATYRTRMYKKPGTYLNGLLLVDRRTALLASAPSEFVAISLPSLLRKKDRSPACLAVGCHGPTSCGMVKERSHAPAPSYLAAMRTPIMVRVLKS